VYVCIALCAGLKLAVKCPPGGFNVTLRAEPDATAKFSPAGTQFIEALGLTIQESPFGNYASSHPALATDMEVAMLMGATLAAFEHVFRTTPPCKGSKYPDKTLHPLDVIARLQETV